MESAAFVLKKGNLIFMGTVGTGGQNPSYHGHCLEGLSGRQANPFFYGGVSRQHPIGKEPKELTEQLCIFTKKS